MFFVCKPWRDTSLREIVSWKLLQKFGVRHIPKTLRFIARKSVKINFCGNPIKRFTQATIIQCIEFLSDLHNLGLCHGDIKPANLLEHQGQVYFIDFQGLCYRNSAVKFYTPWYIKSLAAHTEENDRFALWVSICEVELKNCGQNPYLFNPQDESHQVIMHRIIEQHRPELIPWMNFLLSSSDYSQIISVSPIFHQSGLTVKEIKSKYKDFHELTKFIKQIKTALSNRGSLDNIQVIQIALHNDLDLYRALLK